jgi:hypothetical protein
VAVDFSESSFKALEWVVQEFYRKGDIIHVVHIAPVLSPSITIQHSAPEYSYACFRVVHLHPDPFFTFTYRFPWIQLYCS